MPYFFTNALVVTNEGICKINPKQTTSNITEKDIFINVNTSHAVTRKAALPCIKLKISFTKAFLL